MALTRIEKLELKAIEAAWHGDAKAVKAIFRGIERIRGNTVKPIVGKIFGVWLCQRGMVCGQGVTVMKAWEDFENKADIFFGSAANDSQYESANGPRQG